MHPQIQEIRQTENGVRNVMEGIYKGTKIEVVSGYDVSHDNWPFHVYLTEAGRTRRLFDAPTQYRARSLQFAFEQGMEMAVHHLDPPEAGFQREVKR